MTAKINTRKDPLSGDITVKRKADKVQLIREPKIVLCTLTAEDAIKLSHEILANADKVLQATGVTDEE